MSQNKSIPKLYKTNLRNNWSLQKCIWRALESLFYSDLRVVSQIPNPIYQLVARLDHLLKIYYLSFDKILTLLQSINLKWYISIQNLSNIVSFLQKTQCIQNLSSCTWRGYFYYIWFESLNFIIDSLSFKNNPQLVFVYIQKHIPDTATIIILLLFNLKSKFFRSKTFFPNMLWEHVCKDIQRWD